MVPTIRGSVLAVDLDGVCADYDAGLRAFVAAERDIDAASLPVVTSWDPTRWGWGFDSYDDFLALHGRAVDAGLFAGLPVIDGAVEVLSDMAAAGVRICIVTHRLIRSGQHQRVGADTLAWLDRNRIPYSDLCFLKNKGSIVTPDTTFIDDSPLNVQAVREAGGYAIVFDQPYNRAVPGPRLHGWPADWRQFADHSVGVAG